MANSEITVVKGTVTGRVQGVGFRYFVQEVATKLGIVGWVRNLSDGRVEFELQGEQTAIKDTISRIKEGPAYAKVESIDYSTIAANGTEQCSDFSIRY